MSETRKGEKKNPKGLPSTLHCIDALLLSCHRQAG